MRRVILTLVAGVLLVWLLLPSREAPPAPPEPAAAEPLQAPAAAASAAPDAGVHAGEATRTNDVGQQLREEIKGVVGGGGNSGLSKFNPFVN